MAGSGAEEFFGSDAALRASAVELEKLLRARGVYFGDGLLPTYAYAFVAPRARTEQWGRDAEAIIEAAERLAHRMLEDRAFAETMGFEHESLDLVRIDPGYRRINVICRPDGIPSDDNLKFVELNCDSPAMMMFLDIVARCVLELDALAPLRGKVALPSSADVLLDALLGCYREYGGQGEPAIAIADWEGQKTRFEHARLAEHFEARGCPTVVCDPRALRRVDGKLEVTGRRIDLVYRRALAAELIERRTEIAPLLDAYRDGSVCMVNPLRSYLTSAKAVLSEIARLPNERASQLVPRTLLLDSDEARATVLAAPARWAVKKSESHGGMNVVLPGPATERAWREAVAASTREAWIAQEYIEVPRMRVPILDGDALRWSEKYYNWNPFVFGGRFAGGLVRVSETPLINITLGGGLLPSLPV